MLIIVLLGRKMASSSRMTAREFRKKLAVPKSEAMDTNPTKLFNFGPYQLFSFRENQYKAPQHLTLDENQQMLLDNIWNAKTQAHKTQSLQALSQYLASIQKKPVSKNFSPYVVVQGNTTGVFLK